MKKLIIGTIKRPAMSGATSISNLFTTGIFAGAKVKIDPLFQQILDTLGESFTDYERKYLLFQTNEDTNSYIDEIVMNIGYDVGCICETTALILRANLEYLSGDGSTLLTIPESEDEQNFILNYIKDDEGKFYVLFVEHEFEDGIREIHLHARKPHAWGKDTPAGLFQSSHLMDTSKIEK